MWREVLPTNDLSEVVEGLQVLAVYGLYTRQVQVFVPSLPDFCALNLLSNHDQPCVLSG